MQVFHKVWICKKCGEIYAERWGDDMRQDEEDKNGYCLKCNPAFSAAAWARAHSYRGTK